MEQATPPLQLVSWSAEDFKMESAETARAYCLAPPWDPSTEPVPNKHSLVDEWQIRSPNLLLKLHSFCMAAAQ